MMFENKQSQLKNTVREKTGKAKENVEDRFVDAATDTFPEKFEQKQESQGRTKQFKAAAAGATVGLVIGAFFGNAHKIESFFDRYL